MTGFDDEALLQEFVAEGREHLASIEPDLLVLERDAENTDAEIINRIFRAIHSIKGASGFFGLNALKSLSHSMENIFMQFRDGKLVPSADAMDPLLLGVDRLRTMFEDIHASESVPYEDIVSTLESMMGNGSPSKKTSLAISEAKDKQASPDKTFKRSVPFPNPYETSTEPVPDIWACLGQNGKTAIEEALRFGQHFYYLRLTSHLADPAAFLELLTTTGTVLSSTIPLDESLAANLSTQGGWELLYTSVLEAELIVMTFELSDGQLSEIPAEDILEKISASKVRPGKQKNAKAKMPAKSALQPEEKDISPSVISNVEIPAVADSHETSSSPFPNNAHATKPVAKPSMAGTDSNESIRVKVDLLNRLMDLAGELVLARNQLSRLFKSQSIQNGEMAGIIQNVDLVTSDLQEHIMQTRMQAISSVFGKFPRLVRDLSRQLGKEIELKMSGEEVELDKSILESLSDPLTHLIRNCCDHAMELPETRVELGKPRQGTIWLKAYQESGHINIAIIDDGAGIDHERIARKALESGIMTEAAIRQMSPQEQVNLIFLPGFSTADKVTDVSGRGVGMDVVRTNIEQIGGSISIATEKGIGTTISLRLPLTLAIIPSLVVRTCGQTYAVPQINLVELVLVKASQIASRVEKVGSASVLRLRGKLLPLIKLSQTLGLPETGLNPDLALPPEKRVAIHDERLALVEDLTGESISSLPAEWLPPERRQSSQSDYSILVLKAGSSQYGLIVDEICDIEEIVVKPLSSFLKNCRCFSGATIMGDGKIAMILDVAGLITMSGLTFVEQGGDDLMQAQGRYLEREREQSMLLFNNSGAETFALPVDSILRIEKIQLSSIERVGDRKFLPYQGKTMSLTMLHEHLPVSRFPDGLEEAYLIIPKKGDYLNGLVVSSILDTVDFRGEVEPISLRHTAVSGSAVVNGHVTLFMTWDGLQTGGVALPGDPGISSKLFQSQLQDTGEQGWQAGHLQPSV